LARQHTPHVTLAYARDTEYPVSSIEPVPWTAADVALIRSVAGCPAHEILARWRLKTQESSAQ
ncbi:MAG: hypothetical protein M3Y93_09345, partial [Pseudomonadota bacterium]|nr:hypothetical protein [Pseudomonadota bacterium]